MTEKTIADAMDKDRMDEIMRLLKQWDIALEKMYNTAPEEWKKEIDYDAVPDEAAFDLWKIKNGEL